MWWYMGYKSVTTGTESLVCGQQGQWGGKSYESKLRLPVMPSWPPSKICLKDSVALQQNCKHFIKHFKPSSPYFVLNNILKTCNKLTTFFPPITDQLEHDLIIWCDICTTRMLNNDRFAGKESGKKLQISASLRRSHCSQSAEPGEAEKVQ